MNATRYELRVTYETNRTGVVSYADTLDAAKAKAAPAWGKRAPNRGALLGATILDRVTGATVRASGDASTPSWW